MFRRKVMQRTPSLVKRIFRKKISLPTPILSQLDSLIPKDTQKNREPSRILLIGESAEVNTVIEYLNTHLPYPMYRIDLAVIGNKYIGETEKNLDKLFAKAKKRNGILFFDKADALFGKRTEVEDGHDRYENTETEYLLQRIERFEGLVVLASNFKRNVDDAFLRRLKAKIISLKSTEDD